MPGYGISEKQEARTGSFPSGSGTVCRPWNLKARARNGILPRLSWCERGRNRNRDGFLKSKDETCFRRYANLLAFHQHCRAHTTTGACACANRSAFPAARYCTDGGANSCADCTVADGLLTLVRTSVLEYVALDGVGLLSDKNLIEHELKFALSTQVACGLDLGQSQRSVCTFLQNDIIVDRHGQID